jgi:hypothetical protein
VSSNERSGLPLKGLDPVRAVWVDLRRLFGRGSAAAEGIDMSRPAPRGLHAWLRTADGAWVGRVSYVVVMTDGSTRKFTDQLVPAHALIPR